MRAQKRRKLGIEFPTAALYNIRAVVVRLKRTAESFRTASSFVFAGIVHR